MKKTITLKGYLKPMLAGLKYLQEEFSWLKMQDEMITVNTKQGVYAVPKKKPSKFSPETMDRLANALGKDVLAIGVLEEIVEEHGATKIFTRTDTVRFEGFKNSSFYEIELKKDRKECVIEIKPYGGS